MTEPNTEAPSESSNEAEEPAEPMNREERRALARGKKGKPGKKSLGNEKGRVRSQQPQGGVGKHTLPTKNG